MKKFNKTIKNAPTDAQLDKLCREVCLFRARYKSELSGASGTVLQWHHILHKPNHRLRWELSNIIILTQSEHMSYHEFEKKVVYDPQSAENAKILFEKFLRKRGTTHDNLLMLKRQSGGVNKIAL